MVSTSMKPDMHAQANEPDKGRRQASCYIHLRMSSVPTKRDRNQTCARRKNLRSSVFKMLLQLLAGNVQASSGPDCHSLSHAWGTSSGARIRGMTSDLTGLLRLV
jgi:hypothetical protein